MGELDTETKIMGAGRRQEPEEDQCYGRVKPPPLTLAFHVGAVLNPDCSTSNPAPMNSLEKQVEYDSIAYAPAPMLRTQKKLLASDQPSAECCSCLGESTGNGRFSLSSLKLCL